MQQDAEDLHQDCAAGEGAAGKGAAGRLRYGISFACAICSCVNNNILCERLTLFLCVKNECFTLPTVGKEHALDAFTSRGWHY